MRISNEGVADLFATIYQKQAETYGGDTTLNEMRVMAAFYQAHTVGRRESITSIADTLSMPTSTVHRAIANMTRRGWLESHTDPSDGRKRQIRLTKQGLAGGRWRQVGRLVRRRTQ